MEKVTSKFLVKLGSDTWFLFVAVQKRSLLEKLDEMKTKMITTTKQTVKEDEIFAGTFFQSWKTASEIFVHGEAKIR